MIYVGHSLFGDCRLNTVLIKDRNTVLYVVILGDQRQGCLTGRLVILIDNLLIEVRDSVCSYVILKRFGSCVLNCLILLDDSYSICNTCFKLCLSRRIVVVVGRLSLSQVGKLRLDRCLWALVTTPIFAELDSSFPSTTRVGTKLSIGKSALS